MCQGLGTAVESLAREEDWLPARACDLLLRHFRRPLGGWRGSEPMKPWSLSGGAISSPEDL